MNRNLKTQNANQCERDDVSCSLFHRFHASLPYPMSRSGPERKHALTAFCCRYGHFFTSLNGGVSHHRSRSFSPLASLYERISHKKTVTIVSSDRLCPTRSMRISDKRFGIGTGLEACQSCQGHAVRQLIIGAPGNHRYTCGTHAVHKESAFRAQLFTARERVQPAQCLRST